MAEVTSYAPGTPSWVDLMTSDPEGARAFYGGLFGWDFEIGSEDTGYYTMCQLRGRNVAGMGGEAAPEGMPTAWTTYMAADDVEAIAESITDNGGKLLMGPMDVMDFGRLVVGFDTTGAAFGAWQAGNHIGAEIANEPGTITWNELSTRDLASAQEFYSAVFGYGWDAVDTGPGGPVYRTFSVDGRTVGGAMQVPGTMPQEIPPHWMPYFDVADTDAAVAEAQRLGGQVTVRPTDSAFGRWANITDPQGGFFTIMKSSPA